jgi:hypothetical protein
MKTIFPLCLALVAVNVASAQMFRPQAMQGGGRERQTQHQRGDGGRDGRHDGRFGDGRLDHGRGYDDFHHGHAPYRHAPAYDRHDRHFQGHLGFGYYGGYYPYSYFPRYSYVPSYGYYSGYGYGYPYYDNYGYYGSSSAATNGLLLGALAGGIIGHNSGDLHHSAWRGSAWGAGLGWLLGSVVDSNRRAAAYRSAPVVAQQPAVVQAPAQPAASAQPQQVTIINNYYNSSTPMSGVNGMFGR